MKPKFRKVRSGLEARIIKDLEQRNIKYEYESLRIKYAKKHCPHCGLVTEYGTYTPDFTFTGIGSDLIVEAKGRWTSTDRSKIRLVLQSNDKLTLHFVFQRNHPIRKGSTTRYSDVCDKLGIIYHIGESIPKEWLNGR